MKHKLVWGGGVLFASFLCSLVRQAVEQAGVGDVAMQITIGALGLAGGGLIAWGAAQNINRRMEARDARVEALEKDQRP